MEGFDAEEVGRDSVKSVNATTLAQLMKQLVNRYEQTHKSKGHHYKYHIKCKEKLEIVPKKTRRGEDEGFESDEDAHSTTSSCCLVEDHVFKSSKVELGSTDSANSSGSSDTDELELHSLTPPLRPQVEKEEYPISDVLFCHTEPKYPNVVAWVIKKPQSEFDVTRLGKTGVESISRNENCLQVIVMRCRNQDGLKKLCADYQEFRKRIKLDHYKSFNRRRDTIKETKDIKVSLADMKLASSGLIKASELSILNPKIMSSFKTELKNSVSLNSLIKPESVLSQKLRYSPVPRDMKKAESLSNISSNYKSDTTPADFNLVQTTDLDGVTHIEVSKGGESVSRYVTKSKVRKEIEGVILTEVDSFARRDPVRQRLTPIVVEGELWRPDEARPDEMPPVRPERRKYIRKKQAAPLPPTAARQPSPPMVNIVPDKSKSRFYLAIERDDPSIERGSKVVTGQYIRVQSWGNQRVPLRSPEPPTLGTWKPQARLSRRSEENNNERRRSKSAGRTAGAARKTPMAYRYIDMTEPQESQRRRSSFDDITNLEPRSTGNLKSVIKKNKKMNEPKKVTFSAFATVQVVD